MALNKKTHNRLLRIKADIQALQDEVTSIQKAGIDVDAINAALAALNTDVDALIASHAGAITAAQAQTIVDGLTALGAKVKAATV